MKYPAPWLLVVALTGCGVSMEEVKQEILPQVDRNTRGLESLRDEQGARLETLSRSLSELQVSASALDDRLKLLREQILRELEAQNAHLREVDRLQLEILEKTQSQLEERLRGTRELIERLRAKTQDTAPAPGP